MKTGKEARREKQVYTPPAVLGARVLACDTGPFLWRLFPDGMETGITPRRGRKQPAV